MGCTLGTTVGYTIRFDDKTTPKTRIKYMTDGMMLRELLNDSELKRYSVIILDEAHERTLSTDILFGAIKGIMSRRPTLKVVVMSATLNAKAFSSYFNNAEIINVPGRQFPVTTYFAPAKLTDYLDAALIAVFQVHGKEPLGGDILVFLTGQEEIESLESLINEQAKLLEPSAPKLLVCPIFASLPTSQQTKVFEPTPAGMRKVVISTNIAETSITISGIAYVIDSGMVKVKSYNAKTGFEVLAVRPISQASANQRSGRAGRESSGNSYRLYTEASYNSMEAETEPEIKRCNLSSVILLLKASGINDVVGFDFMDKPSRSALVGALESLYALGALDDTGSLTTLGKKMSGFPVTPEYSKIIIESQRYKCTRDAIDIVSMLSVEPIFFIPNDKRDEAVTVRKTFMNFDGDHITLLNVLKSYQSVNGDSQWCLDHYVSKRSMKQIMDIRNQLISFCEKEKIDTSLTSDNDYEALLKTILSGFFKNVAIRQHDGSYQTLLSRQQVYIHPSSVLFQAKHPCIMFSEWVKTTRQYLRNVSVIQPSWLSEVAPHFYAKNSLMTL
ncbi:P-loop containing nucleoside triphosphate hydrolase protein [Globomyces pollinis-pini]|nr:P-loop containing nucleoside triphosphate hydrolase protein [Globomyces pollinis-pini]